jgi:hypothetical protein
MEQRPKAPNSKPFKVSERVAAAFGDSGRAGVHSGHPPRYPNSAATDAKNAPSRVNVLSKRSLRQGASALEFPTRDAKLLLHIRLETSPQILQQVGEFITTYTKYRFQPRMAERLALASQELIENAVSYGSVSGDVICTLSEAERFIEVCVSNDTSPGRLANLRAQLERLRGDPEQVFLEEMGRSIAGTGARAALGLARICHEAQMDLELDVDGVRVSMHARCAQ